MYEPGRTGKTSYRPNQSGSLWLTLRGGCQANGVHSIHPSLTAVSTDSGFGKPVELLQAPVGKVLLLLMPRLRHLFFSACMCADLHDNVCINVLLLSFVLCLFVLFPFHISVIFFRNNMRGSLKWPSYYLSFIFPSRGAHSRRHERAVARRQQSTPKMAMDASRFLMFLRLLCS